MSGIALLLISDGREDYLERTVASAQEALPKLDHLVPVDDSGHKLGFAGAIQEGWRRIRRTDAEWVFHLEGDFLFNAPIPIDRLIAVLEREKKLVQLALKRQPWNEQEIAAGGIVECHPEDFHQRTEHGDIWTEHRRYFTTNPSLYRAALCAQGWPQEEHSEGVFTHQLLEDPAARFGIWGPKFAPPLVEHIGLERVGVGY